MNAGGVFAEDILAMDGAAPGSLLSMSQGTHFVLPQSFLPGGAAMMIPKTSDGRVLFAIPWHGATVVGTTDEAGRSCFCGAAFDGFGEEVLCLSTLLNTLGAGRGLRRFSASGRGFGRWSAKGHGTTSKLSRDHTMLVSQSGLVTVTGGKWTTYRRMGQDAIDHAVDVAGLPKVASRTLDLKLHGWTDDSAGIAESERVYGTDLPLIQTLSDDDSRVERTAASSASLPAARGSLGCALRDGAHGRGCAGSPDTCAVSGCASRDRGSACGRRSACEGARSQRGVAG